MKNYKAGFSLAELLVVIVIMSVLAAISMPAFNAMMGGSSITGASQDLKAAVSQARQYAIMNNKDAQFVIATSNYFKGNAQHQDKWMRAYSIYDPEAEKFVKPWRYLPDGVVFDSSGKGMAFKNQKGGEGNLIKGAPSLIHKLDGADVANNHYISFTPNGRANWSPTDGQTYAGQGGSVTVALAEGFTVPGSSNGGYQLYNLANKTYSSVAGVVVSYNTGRAVIRMVDVDVQ